MAANDKFKKRRERPKERSREQRTPKPNSFLIVSEGEKTEPFYFDGLADYINSKYGKNINVEKPLIDTEGQGMSTVALVEATAKLVTRARVMYQQVWVVFDKDDFNDFDRAIQLANKKGFHTAWSNQSFEYWIYLHFNFSNSALHRDLWVDKLSDIFKKKKIATGGYQKANPDIFNIVTTHGSLRNAVANAERVAENYENVLPSRCDPCTTVYELIQELRPWIAELL